MYLDRRFRIKDVGVRRDVDKTEWICRCCLLRKNCALPRTRSNAKILLVNPKQINYIFIDNIWVEYIFLILDSEQSEFYNNLQIYPPILIFGMTKMVEKFLLAHCERKKTIERKTQVGVNIWFILISIIHSDL